MNCEWKVKEGNAQKIVMVFVCSGMGATNLISRVPTKSLTNMDQPREPCTLGDLSKGPVIIYDQGGSGSNQIFQEKISWPIQRAARKIRSPLDNA